MREPDRPLPSREEQDRIRETWARHRTEALAVLPVDGEWEAPDGLVFEFRSRRFAPPGQAGFRVLCQGLVVDFGMLL